MGYIKCVSLRNIESADREFWELIAQTAFANPFSAERRELNLKLTGSPRGDAQVLFEAVTDRLQKMDAASLRFRDFREEDRDVMRHAFLFQVYHRFFDALDQLVLEQIRAGEKSCKVAFATELLDALGSRGFSRDESLRFFGIFYQLRRAHFFIVHGLIGQSLSMQELRRRLWNNVFTSNIRWYDRFLWNRMEDFSTLLLGETGTGKGAAAAAIGRSSFIPFHEKAGCFAESFAENFISLNLSQFPETLIESELFGHRKGAFTGAIEAHQGVFARCSPHGSIFLDEIGDVSVPVQIKLLQVLQERVFSPVGSRDKVRFRGRVIAATNKSLEKLRQEKLFRDDFYYRLCSDVIVLPTLRQRLEELPSELDALLEHIMARMTGEKVSELVDVVRTALKNSPGERYGWPGNFRELEQAIRRILLNNRYEGDVQIGDSTDRFLLDLSSGSLNAEEVLSHYCSLLYQRHGTFEEVARRTNLDPRTVKRYVEHKNGVKKS
ncbi:MAG: sigma-54-dependent Fis family transcriptional regulator [Verrucomicrobia bacterium]|nr:sigma-54-dependent Fis family transcriptional regulator [Verrucomicrobiota bacterium]